MASYMSRDLVKALEVTKFYPRENNSTSHRKYTNDVIGCSVTISQHKPNTPIPAGTAEEGVLDYVIFAARLGNINIASDRYGLADNVKKYIIKRHAEIKKNPINLIPQIIRKQENIETPEQANECLKKYLAIWKKAQEIQKSSSGKEME